MGKKLKFPFLFKTTELEDSTTAAIATATSWPWPSCGTPKTLSFRAPGDDIFKTMNSAYDTTTTREPPEEDSGIGGGDTVEAVISGLRRAPERLFFEPGETSSILGELKSKDVMGTMLSASAGKTDLRVRQDPYPEKEERRSSSCSGGVLVAMDSRDPYADFKRSMEEMVEANGVKEWDWLEELLGWYLEANGKENHGYIVGAFVDLLVGLASNCNSTTNTSSCSTSCDSDDGDQDRSFSVVTNTTACSLNSPLSFSSSNITCSSACTTPCLSSSVDAEDEIDKATVPN